MRILNRSYHWEIVITPPQHAHILPFLMCTCTHRRDASAQSHMHAPHACRGFIGGDLSSWRALFIGGLLGGGVLVARLMPASLDILPATFTIPRAVGAGLMVGAGAALGNGCTSGHGIAGNARSASARHLVIVRHERHGSSAPVSSGLAQFWRRR